MKKKSILLNVRNDYNLNPMYFEEFKGKKLASLVVDCKPPCNFVANVILMENPIELKK